MRLFFGVDLPASLKEKIHRFLSPQRKKFNSLKWVEKENLHITIKFLGEVKEERLSKISEQITNAFKGLRNFELTLGDFGSFPEKGGLRVLWIGVDSGAEEMKKIHKILEKALSKLGFENEKREFVPHLTLARSRKNSKLDFRELGLKKLQLPPFTVKEIVLFESILKPEGPIYKKIKIFNLSND